MRTLRITVALFLLASTALIAQGRGGRGSGAPPPPLNLPADTPRITQLKAEVAAEVDKLKEFSAQMVDQIFSYGELGFQEVETSRYLIALLKKNGFTIEEGVAGIPTAFMASWGNGKPVIALGSDIDGIPQSSQKPGVAYRDPLVEGAPGHGEGHNSGQVVNITAAIVLKKIMEREKIPGTIRIWPGVAEELVGTKAFFIRAGLFKDVDVALFTHVGRNLSVSWGDGGGTGLVSVQYNFKGESAHAAGGPWRGKSALDAVELMNIGWNFRREHLPLSHRSHYVIKDGGDQPNVVPPTASVWYYFREVTYQGIKDLWAIGDRIAQGAAQMTDTTLLPPRVLGAAWPRHFNRAVAEVTWANIQTVGMPEWTEADQTLRPRRSERAGRQRTGADHTARPAGRTGRSSHEHRRRLRRHRRHLLERSDGQARVPVEHSGPARPQLGRRHRHGHAARAQRRDGRCQGPGDDARRSAAEA